MTDTTHDPLCDSAKCTRCYGHFAYCSHCQCECELIARVRADERQQAAERVALVTPDGDWIDHEQAVIAALGCDA